MNISRRRLVRVTGAYLSAALIAGVAAACGSAEPTRMPEPSATAGPEATAMDVPTPGIAPTPGLTPPDQRTEVPPRQQVTSRFPSLDLGYRPAVAPEDWYLDITGAVENPVTLTWDDFKALPRTSRVWDFHCVTGWTKLDVAWEGVLLSEIVNLARPREDVVAVIFEGRDDYTTNLIYKDVQAEEALLADTLEGGDLALRAWRPGPGGGALPVRLEELQIHQSHPFRYRRRARLLGDAWIQ